MNFERNGFIVVTSSIGSRDIFYITNEIDFIGAVLNNKDVRLYERVNEETENQILKDFFTTLNRTNDNNGTGYEVWKTENFRFILSRFRYEWEHRRVELINQFA